MLFAQEERDDWRVKFTPKLLSWDATLSDLLDNLKTQVESSENIEYLIRKNA